MLFLLPFLLETGLLTFKNHYQELDKGYYYSEFIVLLLALMYLRRIKNPEQLKNFSSGEFGKLMGIDRVPEAKCMRSKIRRLSSQKNAAAWNKELSQTWSSQEENEIYYIDGHVKVYYGYMANLGKKHVARQKLCLPGIQEFWVNNIEGMPYFYVTGQVNEKLQQMIKDHIVELIKQMPNLPDKKQLDADPQLPVFTIVFDREAYSPAFFQQLWDQHRVAVITYRKSVKDRWDETLFESYTIEGELIEEVKLELAEQPVVLNEVEMREIRCLSKDGHQTSVITTNRKLLIQMIAFYMFSRWSQENFFRYLRQDYDFDRIIQYAVNQLDRNIVVSNPAYNKLTYQLKKIREKIQRRKALIHDLNQDDQIDESSQKLVKLYNIQQELSAFTKEEQDLLSQRKQVDSTITLEDMPEDIRYNTIQLESKYFTNIIKMICYRAETSLANLIYPFLKKSINEKRMFVKNIINSSIDIKVNDKEKLLEISLYSLSTPRENEMVLKICKLLNENNCKYPGTDLTLRYNLAT